MYYICKYHDDSRILKFRAWVSKAKTEMEPSGSPFVQRRGVLVSDGCFAKIRLFPMTDSHGTGVFTYIEWLTFMGKCKYTTYTTHGSYGF